MAKYIFITGDVVSSLGKGIAAASLGLILKSRGFKVINPKFDPYLNIDPGTMNSYQHGEIFVTDNGSETDRDLEHYKRVADENLPQSSNTTAGRTHLSALNNEREGGFHGGTVPVIRYSTDEICHRILLSTEETGTDIIITETSRTTGYIESLPFIEAIRHIKYDAGAGTRVYIHLTLLPYIKKSGKLKSKQTQHNIKELQWLGIQPDIIALRNKIPVNAAVREKTALSCNVSANTIIQNFNTNSIGEFPLMIEQGGLGTAVCQVLSIPDIPSRPSKQAAMVNRMYHPAGSVQIALVGKYTVLKNVYLSVAKILLHDGIHSNIAVPIDQINAKLINSPEVTGTHLKNANRIIIPGGFGDRGIKDMIVAVRYTRKHIVPHFSICLEMQILIIEYVRNVLGLTRAHSKKMNKATPVPFIDLMPDKDGKIPGGTRHLGKYQYTLKQGSTAVRRAYRADKVWKSRVYRYEFNNKYRNSFEKAGLIITGTNPKRNLAEICRIPGHSWMTGAQFHPKFKSRPNRAHPLFRKFIAAAAE